MRIHKTMLKNLILIFSTSLLVACSVLNTRTSIPGVTYVASRGNPRADSIVWSSQDRNKILVNAVGLIRQNSQVYILDITTKDKTMLVETDYGGIFVEDWSPDASKILLRVDGAAKGFSQGGMWMMNTDDNSLEFFSNKLNNAVWLPDGNTLVFLTKESSSDQESGLISVYLMDIQTEEMRLIYSTQDTVSFSGFSPSPDGKHLVFWITADNDRTARDLYTLDVQTGVVNQLTFDHISSDPQWSPIGDLIVYVKSAKVDDRTIHSLHIFSRAANCDLKIPNVENAFSPTWSPDGRKIAYIGDDGIYVLDIDRIFERDIYQNPCS